MMDPTRVRAAERLPVDWDRGARLIGVCAALFLQLSVAACAGLELDPIINDRRVIRAAEDRGRTIIVTREVVVRDKRRASHELQLPAGTYTLEGEDEEYWYLRSGSALTMQDFHRGGPTDRHTLRGGIALGKYSTRSVPAAVYLDGDGGAKILIWKLGKDFMGGEGRDWQRSF